VAAKPVAKAGLLKGKRATTYPIAGKEDFLIVDLLKNSNLPCEDIAPKLGCMLIAQFGEKIVEIRSKYGLLRSIVIKKEFRSVWVR